MKIMPRRKRALLITLVIAGIGGAASARPRLPEPLPSADRALDRRIDASINRGVDFLLAQKKKNRDHWDGAIQNAVVTWALLNLGRSVDDPRLQANSPELAGSVQWLLSQPSDGALEACFKALAISQMPSSPETKAAAIEARGTLLKFLRTDGSVSSRLAGGAPTLNTTETLWAYEALAALEDCGAEIDPGVWKTGAEWWRGNQLKNGGWPDIRVLPNSDAQATAAGTTALFLTAARSGKPAASAPVGTTRDLSADLALKRVINTFDPRLASCFHYYLFERAVSAAGLASINDGDWYKTSAEELLRQQRDAGNWTQPEMAALPGDGDVYATAFALLYLARGRDPVVFSKFEYAGASGHWNDRPHDDANLTSWLAREWDRPLNWQTVNAESPESEWARSPVLLITGSGDPNFSGAEIEKLRQFVQRGGLIFSSADNGDAAFTTAIVKKYAPLVADNHYEMRLLPQTHELFGGELYGKIPTPLGILGMSNGVREWWIHSPVDMGATWESRKLSAREHFILPANLVRYATGNGSLKNKLQTPPMPPATPVETARTITLARLEYTGNFDPEPTAWNRLSAFAPPLFHTLLEVRPVKIADLDAAKTPVAHITGTATFALSDPELKALKKFLDDGGVLLADSAGASPRFTASFRELMTSLYPNTQPAELPVNDPVFNGSIADSIELKEIEYRKFSKPSLLRPRIEAITVHGRHVILFSPEDMTSGLLGTDTWGIRGYTPASATNLARNLLLYATMK